MSNQITLSDGTVVTFRPVYTVGLFRKTVKMAAEREAKSSLEKVQAEFEIGELIFKTMIESVVRDGNQITVTLDFIESLSVRDLEAIENKIQEIREGPKA